MTTDSIHPPRPLLESLNLQTTFSKRKKKKIFPSKFHVCFVFLIELIIVVERRDDNDDDRLDASPGKVKIKLILIEILREFR